MARSVFSAYSHGKLVSIPVEAVTHLVCENKYVEAHHADGVLLLDESLTGIVDDLPGLFVRCHRGAAVARRLISKFAPSNNFGQGRVWLTGIDDPVKVSDRYSTVISTIRKQSMA